MFYIPSQAIGRKVSHPDVPPNAESPKARRAPQALSRAALRVVMRTRNLRPNNVLKPRIVVCSSDLTPSAFTTIPACMFKTTSNAHTDFVPTLQHCTRTLLLLQLESLSVLDYSRAFCAPTQVIGCKASQPDAPANVESPRVRLAPLALSHAALRVVTRALSLPLSHVLKPEIAVRNV